jgi:probable addiction module antidote protein
MTASTKETFSRWDAADYLRSEADMAAYLQAVLDEAPSDAALLAEALGDIARAKGMVQLARDTGLTREGLYKALSKDGNPRLDTVLKVLHALGLKLTPQPEQEPARSETPSRSQAAAASGTGRGRATGRRAKTKARHRQSAKESPKREEAVIQAGDRSR